jgi:hypothetical protein
MTCHTKCCLGVGTMGSGRRPGSATRGRTLNSLTDATCTSSWTDEPVQSDGSRTNRRIARNLLNSPQRCQLRTMLHRLSDVESTYAAGSLVGIRRRDHSPATAAPDTAVLVWSTRRMAAAANPAECIRVPRADGWHVNRLSKHEAWNDSCLSQEGHVVRRCRHVRG